jgi:uncharacterized membrane protein YfcA
MTWQFVLTGMLIGVLVGMTGMGGGSLMTPILVIVFGFKPTLAVGTDILHGAIFKTVGAIRHRRLGTVHHQLSGWMFLGSAPFSLLGVALATRIEHRYGDSATEVMGYILGGALLFGAVGLVLKSFVKKTVVGDDRFEMEWRDRFAAIAIGIVGGFIVGLTSVGSGTFFGLTMLFVFSLSAHKVVGTDILHAAALLYVAGFGHFVAGNVDMHAVGWLLIGSVPGVLIGSHYSVRIPEAWLRLALADVLAISGLKLVQVPNVYLAIAIGVSIAAGAVIVVRTQRRLRAEGKEAAGARRRNLRAVEFRGRAPVPLDPARRRVAGRDGGLRSRSRRGSRPAEPDHGAAGSRRSSRRVRLRDARRRDPVQAAQADRVRLQIVDGERRRRRGPSCPAVGCAAGRSPTPGTAATTRAASSRRVYKPRVHLADQHRTIDLPNEMQVDTTAPRISIVSLARGRSRPTATGATTDPDRLQDQRARPRDPVRGRARA